MNIHAIVIVLLCLLLVATAYYMLKFAMDLIEIEDRLNQSISDIEESYRVFNDISKKPVFFDSLEIRQCIDEIVKTREALLRIVEDLRNIRDSRQNYKEESKELYEKIRQKEND